MSTRGSARRRLLLCAAALAASARPLAARSEGAAPLRVGLVPYLSTRSLMALYEPLREHLERTLQRPVRLYTARDFRTLALNARDGEYDMALLPPHVARIAVADWAHALVARFAQTSEVQLATLPATAIELPAGLRGRRIATIDPLSITTLALRRWLGERGLVVGRDVGILYAHSIASGVVALERGDVIALVGAIGQFRDIVEGVEGKVKVVATLASIPTPAFVAHPGMPAAEVQRIRQALLEFVPQSAGAGISRSPFVTGSVQDFARVESYSAEARRLLAETN